MALLTPLPDHGPLDRLRAGGQLDESDGDLDELPEPLVLPLGTEPPSAALARLRHSER